MQDWKIADQKMPVYKLNNAFMSHYVCIVLTDKSVTDKMIVINEFNLQHHAYIMIMRTKETESQLLHYVQDTCVN